MKQQTYFQKTVGTFKKFKNTTREVDYMSFSGVMSFDNLLTGFLQL